MTNCPPDVMRSRSAPSLVLKVNALLECSYLISPTFVLPVLPNCNFDSPVALVAFIKIAGLESSTDSLSAGIAVPIPTLPPSLTVRTSVVPSNKFTISAVPLCIPTIAVSVLLFAPILTRSTPIKFVSSVVVVPSTVKLLLTLRS